MVGPATVPDAGDLVWLSFSPQAGHEMSGRRPALVLSPRSYNEKTGLALACPVTSRSKGYPFEVHLPAGGSITGVVLADQVKCLDWRARRAELASRASPRTVGEVLSKLGVILPGV
ncbi:MAG: endoribonuclease MazF [Gemmatimonadetes bacterium]|nr:endoribonuclease MazF [Gemmatimonadota bacterium]MYH54031.1 endoribonuclease MazF [Gemmatimonadota bacterium]MYK66630.1 endoribonuclease MazF [Gemmatimonadota bacterium]